MKIEDIEMDNYIDVDINSNGVLLAPKNDLIALIDADTIVFGACSEKEYCETVDVGVGDVDFQEIYNIDVEEAFNHAMGRIQSILDYTGCKDFELHFTSGRESFRYTRVDSEYKATRLGGRYPAGLAELKSLFIERFDDKAFLWREFEADDVVVYKKLKEPEKYMMCAIDKDVLFAVAGNHFNYYSSKLYNIDMKHITVSEDVAMKHLWFQVLMGDSSDNIIGLKGVGKKTAEKLLANCKSTKDCMEVVKREYLAKGRCITDAIKNIRLVSMYQLVEVDGVYKIELWKDNNFLKESE